MLKLVKKILLIVAIATTIASAQALRFPTNVRFIAGGYINKSPYFNNLNSALNDVKAFATSSNPYTFWVDGDTSFISDWDSVYNGGQSMKDSIDTYYVSLGIIKWAGFGFGGTGSGGVSWLVPDTHTMYYDFPTYIPGAHGAAYDSAYVKDTAIDNEIHNLIVYTGKYLYIQNDTLRVDTAGLALSMGITAGSITADTANFVGTDTLVNVSITGATPTDIYMVQPLLTYTTDTINLNDGLYVKPVTNGVWVKRHAGGTANLKFLWIRMPH